MTVFRGFEPRKVLVYLLAQFFGAVVAAALLYFQFKGALLHFEATQGIIRGEPGSVLSAMVFGEYFPHPGLQSSLGWAPEVVTIPKAMMAEFIGTAFLAAVIFALTDPDNTGTAGEALIPAFIGLTVAIIISVLAPMTQAGLNPARDFGPRLVAFFAGWGAVAIPGPSGGFFVVYILSPCLGALTGAGLYVAMTKYGRQRSTANLEVQRPAEVAAVNGERIKNSPPGKDAFFKRSTSVMSKHSVIIVGGFLGSGKTTLLAQARRLLEEKGLKTGLITNDQAPGLVDTVWLGGGDQVLEVAGSCFCCNFPAFEKSLAALSAWGAQYILAEPVGSCTDLTATILEPLSDMYRDNYDCTPFTVLLDPDRSREILGQIPSKLHPDAFYILGCQLQEADLIVLNKTDLLAPGEESRLAAKLSAAFPEAVVRTMSGRNGDGVSAWLDEVMGTKAGARKMAQVDYDRYANGEAVLGWLNLEVDLPFGSRGGESRVDDFMERLRNKFSANNYQIGHVKVLWPSPEGVFIGNLTDLTKKAAVTSSSNLPVQGPVLVNARVECEPAALDELVRQTLGEIGQEYGQPIKIIGVHCLKPGRPNPTYRYKKIG
jgi:glycerol uptake facilitator-like aquaporin/G3E family GTPase